MAKLPTAASCWGSRRWSVCQTHPPQHVLVSTGPFQTPSRNPGRNSRDFITADGWSVYQGRNPTLTTAQPLQLLCQICADSSEFQGARTALWTCSCLIANVHLETYQRHDSRMTSTSTVCHACCATHTNVSFSKAALLRKHGIAMRVARAVAMAWTCRQESWSNHAVRGSLARCHTWKETLNTNVAWHCILCLSWNMNPLRLATWGMVGSNESVCLQLSNKHMN